VHVAVAREAYLLGFFSSAVVGYRLQGDHFFFEVGLGPALTYQLHDDELDVTPLHPPSDSYWRFEPGAVGGPFWFIPDVGLAVGYQF